MAARVLYGLARLGDLPAVLGTVNARTHVPLVATVLSTVAVLVLAVAVPLHNLAEATSRLTLVVFTFVNLSLVAIKRRPLADPQGIYIAPSWVPWAGAAACVTLLAFDAWTVLSGL